MIEKVIISPSNRRGKLFTANIFEDGVAKKIHFGDINAEQYPTHKDDARKENYIRRHQAREDWTDPYTAGFWSRFILWNKPTIEESIRDVAKKINAEVFLLR